MAGNYELLATTVIARYIAPLLDRRQNPLPENLTLLRRTPEVDRTDGEIVATSTGQVYAADIIADDQEANVYNAEAFTLQPNKIPNLKHGKLLTQEMLNLINRINAGTVAPGEDGIFRNYVTRQYDALINGIAIRKNALLWQMAQDSGSYDRLGIKFSGLSWGMPADLKFQANPLWSDAANATPIKDIQNHQAAISAKYGKTYNRLSLSTDALVAASNTAEFKARLQMFSGFTFPAAAAAFPTSDVGLMTTLIGRLLNLTVEVEDFQYREQQKDGSDKYTRFLDRTVAVLSNTSDDNNSTARDIANAVVTETLVGNMPGMSVLGGVGLGAARSGPVGYATGNPDLNPPQARLWAVQRCIPELLDKTCFAKLSVL